MKLSAKGVDETAIGLDLQDWDNLRRRKDSGRRIASPRRQRGLQRQAAFRRNNATRAERMLSAALRAGKLFGTSWRRQHVIDDLIADMYCRTARLIVEIRPDGRKWSRQGDVDYLNSQGFAVLRFTESEVIERLEWVLELIRGVCHKQLRLATRRGRTHREAEKLAPKSAQRVESAAQSVEAGPQDSPRATPIQTRWSRVRETVSSLFRSAVLDGGLRRGQTSRISTDTSSRSPGSPREPAAVANTRARRESRRGHTSLSYGGE